MAMTPEGRVKKAVKALLTDMGIHYYMPMQTGYGVVGIPDFICCWNGRYLAVETKAPGKLKNTTANQDRVISEIRRAKGLAIVVDSAEMLREFLEKEM